MKLCKVADIADWQSSEFQSAELLLGLTGYRNRKTWEFIQVYSGLRNLGLLNGAASALGLGVGHEELIYAFTNVCKEVVATDLYNSQNWDTASMTTDEVYHRNPFPYHSERLVVQHMDMTQIEYPDNRFDFVWSCCAIEHVNNFRDLHKVYQEIHRVLKPGGVVALTTEFNPTDLPSYEPNMLFTDRYWMEQWLTGSDSLVQGFDLLNQPDYFLSPAQQNEPKPRRAPERSIQIYCNDIVLNSIAFFLRKSGEFSRPYTEDWLPQFWSSYLAGCDRYREKNFQGSETVLQQLLHADTLVARLRLKALRRLADALFAQGKLQEVQEVCQKALPYCEQVEDGDQLMPMAHYYKGVGLVEEAKDLYEKVSQLSSTSREEVIRSLILQAECLGLQGQYEQALTFLEEVVQQIPLELPLASRKPRINFQQGFFSEKLRQFKPAIAFYRSVLNASPPAEPKLRVRCNRRINSCLHQINAQQRTQLKQLKAELAQFQGSKFFKLYSIWALVKKKLRVSLQKGA